MPYRNIFKNIFNKNIDEAGSNSMLQQITTDFPYFNTAHFFLLKNEPPGSEAYNKIAAKTALHFNNVFLLNYNLNKSFQTLPETATHRFQPQEAEISQLPKKENIEIEKESSHYSSQQSASPVSPSFARPDDQVGRGGPVPPKREVEEALFEPLHATDYFASQGIKLSEELLTADKLGKQVKSFTEWLKTMKKINENNLGGTGVQDIAIQNLAAKSNKEEIILTEAMADVYAQQGKSTKAIEVYVKLSLQNPEKIAYFAAKINSLKI